ncbi:Cytochrome c oxidase assembly factor 1 [Escovopsis weberi]|uniref:Cytochrome c oxidase assembly factor 1 n=1 Tax=Escovopsis weberi TaxID=150374 RepID=A0A0M8N8X5_ESCWE|nr:Cytochrome c oxidase assembly factor 1 [Escovopsis weberi]
MFSRSIQRRLVASLRGRRDPAGVGANGRALQRRWITPAPKPGDGPLMSRRADRELPDMQNIGSHWRRTLPLFLAVVTACSVAIFNYQKSSSPIISSTLYALRVSPRARALLGDEIYFKHQIPWISGEMNQMRGRVDVSFSVRGSKATGVMRFASYRPSSKSLFETTAWSLTMDDGTVVDLLEGVGGDPFKGLLSDEQQQQQQQYDEGVGAFATEDKEAQTRGFRQQGAYNR